MGAVQIAHHELDFCHVIMGSQPENKFYSLELHLASSADTAIIFKSFEISSSWIDVGNSLEHYPLPVERSDKKIMRL